MAVTKFAGPINSVEGFQFNGTASTWVATMLTLSTGEGSIVSTAAAYGLSTVLWGIAKHQVVHGGTYLYPVVETSKNGVVGSSASFQVTCRKSTDATMSLIGPTVMGADATITVVLMGAG